MRCTNRQTGGRVGPRLVDDKSSASRYFPLVQRVGGDDTTGQSSDIAASLSRSRGERVSVAVYTRSNLNAIDGSSVWVQSVALALAKVTDIDLSLVLSHPIENERIIGPLLANPRVRIIDPFQDGPSSPQAPLPFEDAVGLLSGLDVDAIILRGAEVATRLANEPELTGKLYPYLTDIPQRAGDVDLPTQEMFERIMAASPFLLCQTEEMRDFLESHIPSVAGKTWLLPPIVPDDLEVMAKKSPRPGGLYLCYSGKFAPMWNTYEMCNLPRLLEDRGVTAELTMVGDKINRDPERPEYVSEMRERLESSPGVRWVGGVSRAESMRKMARAHVGLSWRSAALDHSLELSTKLIEYCSVGTPPILNRTAMHERVFGSDYPLFANSEEEVLDQLVSISRSRRKYKRATRAISDVADRFSLTRAGERLAELFAISSPTD